MRYILSVKKWTPKVARIFRVGREAPADAVTLQAVVFLVLSLFDVQLCSDGRRVVMYRLLSWDVL